MQPDYDDLDDLEEGGFNWMLVTVLLLAVAGFCSLAWYAYQTGAQQADTGDVLVIKADSEPVRSRPEDPGGRTFAHQDKTIYEAIGDGEDEVVEIRLQPDAETPNLEQEEVISADEKVAQILQNAVRDAQKETEQKKAQPKAEPVKVVEPEPKPAPVAEPTPVSTTPVGSGERVQLGAFRSNAEAEKHWQKVSRDFKSTLAGKPHQVVRADLGDKGVFYRLRVAGFADKDAAKATCKALTAGGQGCFVVQ